MSTIDVGWRRIEVLADAADDPGRPVMCCPAAVLSAPRSAVGRLRWKLRVPACSRAGVSAGAAASNHRQS